FGRAALAFLIDEWKNFPKCGFGKIESGHDQGFARLHHGPRHRRRRHGGERRDVATPDVLGQGGLDGSTDFRGGQFHAAKMEANRKNGKGKTGESTGWMERGG